MVQTENLGHDSTIHMHTLGIIYIYIIYTYMQLLLPNISHPCKPPFPSWLEAKCWLGGNAAISHWNVRKIPENLTTQLRPQTNKTWQKQRLGLFGAGQGSTIICIYIYMCMFNPRANFLRGVWSTVVNLNTYLLCLSALRAVPVPSAAKNCIQLRYLPGKQRLGMGHLTSYYSLPCQTASKFSKFKSLPHTPRKKSKIWR